jgi:CheY-like chemotaxis protein
MPDEVRRAREAGADAFLRKPVAPARVLEHIRSLIGQPVHHAR